MERLEFENYEAFACEIADTFDSVKDEFGDISIIATYDEAKEIIRELLCLGYDVASIDIYKEEFEEYWDEYRVALNQDGIWCDKFKHENGYFTDESNVTYVMDDCSSVVFKHIDSDEMYEVFVGEDTEDETESEKEHTYTVNGKKVDKKTFNEYVSKFAPDLVDDEEETSDDDSYSISVKCNLDADEALEIIKDMERRMIRMNDMFCEMGCFMRLFNWHYSYDN